MTLILLRNDRAIFGEEGSDMEEPAESGPERGSGEMRGGRDSGGGISPRGEDRDPLQWPGLARYVECGRVWVDRGGELTDTVSVAGMWGSLHEVTECSVKGCPTSSCVSTRISILHPPTVT